jgi:biopolymer transport protein ExbB
MKGVPMLVEKFFIISQGSADILLWALLITSVLSIGMIIERFMTLRSVYQKNTEFRMKAQDLLQSQSLDELEDLAKNKDSLPGRALSYGLRHVKSDGEAGLAEVFNSFHLIEKPKLERNLNFLATVGSNAPFVGLLGTVLGIMKAFSDLAANSGGGNDAVMAGIAHALVATAVGLFVAIPAVIGYNYFQKLVRQSLQSIDVARELCLAYAKKKKG